MKSNKTVIVTGGAGFLGSNLVPELVKQGYRTIVVDSLISGKAENIPDGAEFFEGDVRSRMFLDEVFEYAGKAGGIYGVFHLAALPRVQFSIDHPRESFDTNVSGTLNLFEAARAAGVRRIVFSASSSAYGDQDSLPLREEMTPMPKSPYAMQKLMGELIARQYSMHYGIETVCLRYFNIFGPRFDPNGPYAMAIGKFLLARKEGRPLTVTGDGNQTRDCVFATDVARANILAMESPKVGKGEVINIGSGRNARIVDIAKMIGGEIIHIAPRVEPHDTRADITRAKELLGWEPKVTLEEGIALLKRDCGIK